MFLGVLAKSRKTTLSFAMHIRSSVCAWSNSASTAWIFVKLYIWLFFENLYRNFKFLYSLTRITSTLHEDLWAFMVISRWTPLRMRNVSGSSCRENQDTHFMFSSFFPKIVPFMR
jgi:hypothetical protein